MKCRTKFCRGKTAPHHHSPYCAKCRTRRFKAHHPEKYSYSKLRHRAAERGHEFKLSFNRFLTLWNQGLRDQHGKTPVSLTIHRVDDRRGYEDDNVTIVTLSANVRLKYVPYFQDRARQEQAIADAERRVAEAYGL